MQIPHVPCELGPRAGGSGTEWGDGVGGHVLAEILWLLCGSLGSTVACTRGVCRVSLTVSFPLRQAGKGKLT